MVDHDIRREATTMAADAQKAYDLSDAERECFRDLLQNSETFKHLVTAQQSAVLVADLDDVEEGIANLAGQGAEPLGTAIDRLGEQYLADAREIVALAEDLGEGIHWGTATKLYQAGYETIESIRNDTMHELVAEASLHPDLAEQVKDNVGGQKARGEA